MNTEKPRERSPLFLAVLASGRGTNFEALKKGIEDHHIPAIVKVVISDKEEAPVLSKARNQGIDAIYIKPGQFATRELYELELVRICEEYQVDLIVLAGYMRILGETFIHAFPGRIINIHPSLLPSFPGLNAQKQALEYGVRYTGCTVHFIDSGVDTGPIILQQVVSVLPTDDEDSLAARILMEEHKLLSQAIDLIAKGRIRVDGRKVVILPEGVSDFE